MLMPSFMKHCHLQRKMSRKCFTFKKNQTNLMIWLSSGGDLKAIKTNKTSRAVQLATQIKETKLTSSPLDCCVVIGQAKLDHCILPSSYQVFAGPQQTLSCKILFWPSIPAVPTSAQLNPHCSTAEQTSLCTPKIPKRIHLTSPEPWIQAEQAL